MYRTNHAPPANTSAGFVHCNKRNSSGRKRLGPRVSALVQMCIRNGITAAMLTADGVGYVHLSSSPSTKVFVDGVDTGLVTPVTGTSLPLSAGKHRITFMIGADRYTYPVTVTPGETVTLSKELQ